METYNDGVIYIFEDCAERNTFGAKLNEADLRFVCKFCFCEMTQRQKDQEFAQAEGFSLSLKVKTPFCRLIKKNKKFKAKIGTSLYDVSYYDTSKMSLFFYLEYIREVEDAAGD